MKTTARNRVWSAAQLGQLALLLCVWLSSGLVEAIRGFETANTNEQAPAAYTFTGGRSVALLNPGNSYPGELRHNRTVCKQWPSLAKSIAGARFTGVPPAVFRSRYISSPKVFRSENEFSRLKGRAPPRPF